YSAFSYLARRVSPAQLATYAYVNPLIAVLLGWLLGHESFSASMALGAGLVIGAVILLMRPTRQ
ncbi:MAG TPA: EamA family transporter, partial [Candidatus Obscuribacterales bacterium]